VSRIGKIPIDIPTGVKAEIKKNRIQIQGPKGSLSLEHNEYVKVENVSNQILVTRQGETRTHRAAHGLYQRLISNMVIGVTKGFKKELEIVGVGYRAQVKEGALNLQVGLSHQPHYKIPEGITISAPKPTQIVVEGIDKQKVGQTAAEIRKIRPPEPYKGKGIRYSNERIRRKVGKTGAK